MSVIDLKLALRSEIHDFPEGIFGSASQLTNLDIAREWDTLIIACSEQGAAPDQISFKTENRFAVLQHLAASIPSRAECATYEGLSCDEIEALFDKHEFRHVIVCGHLECGVIRNWLRPSKHDSRDVGGFRARFEAGTMSIVDQHYVTHSYEQRVRLMICEHVLCQVENLITHPFVMDRVRIGATSIHAWIMDDQTARVYGYHPVKNEFALL